MWLSGGIFQDFCCWATQVHLRAVIQEQKPKSTSRALNKQLQNVWIHLFPSLSWSNKVSLSTLPFVSSLNNMNDMLKLNFCDRSLKDKSFHKMTGKNLETKKLNSSLNSGSVVSSTTPVVYYCDPIKKNYCDPIKNYCDPIKKLLRSNKKTIVIQYFFTTRWMSLNLHLWQPWGQETDLDRDVCRLTPIVGWQALTLQHFHLDKTRMSSAESLDWPWIDLTRIYSDTHTWSSVRALRCVSLTEILQEVRNIWKLNLLKFDRFRLIWSFHLPRAPGSWLTHWPRGGADCGLQTNIFFFLWKKSIVIWKRKFFGDLCNWIGLVDVSSWYEIRLDDLLFYQN